MTLFTLSRHAPGVCSGNNVPCTTVTDVPPCALAPAIIGLRRASMARKYSRGASKDVERAMRKRKRGTLRSGRSGKRVTSRKQDIAIGLSEARQKGKKLTERAALAGALGLDASELDSEVESLGPQAASTGAMHLLVPVRSLAALERVRVDAEKLIALASPLGCHGCYLFSLETREQGSAAHARAFFPGIGISEDPATGSAAGPLAAQLASRGLIPEGAWVVIEQGDEMARPSRIEARVRGS